jgi:hypothetical protein
MHIYILLFSAAAVWLFKAGKLNFFVKKGLQKAYSSLFKETDNFNDFVAMKENRNEDNIEIESGFYSYQAEGGVLDTVSYLDFSIDFSLSFNDNTKMLKQSIILTKGAAKHKFTVEGAYTIKGTVVTFIPTEGDLSVLPEELRNSEIKFIVNNVDKGLAVSFNEDQFGEKNALVFERN